MLDFCQPKPFSSFAYVPPDNKLMKLHFKATFMVFMMNSYVFRTTPLMLASSSGNLQAVLVLLKLGAEIHSKNNQGKTAIELAADNGFQNIVQRLQREIHNCIISILVQSVNNTCMTVCLVVLLKTIVCLILV